MRLPLRIARIPPVRAAAVDQLVEFVAGDDALIGRAPRLVMGLGDVHCVGRLRAANLYEGVLMRDRSNELAAFKPYR